jgi:hypothetical protein
MISGYVSLNGTSIDIVSYNSDMKKRYSLFPKTIRMNYSTSVIVVETKRGEI